MAEEGREEGREGTRNTNHVDVKMNCCKLGRPSRREGGGMKPHHRVSMSMGRLISYSAMEVCYHHFKKVDPDTPARPVPTLPILRSPGPSFISRD